MVAAAIAAACDNCDGVAWIGTNPADAPYGDP